jgi:anti-sigma factor RsiW
MTCQECELALGSEESTASLDQHLAACRACRALAFELRANSEALGLLRAEDMPPVRHRVMAQVRAHDKTRKIARWGWALAAAAMIAMVLAWPSNQIEKLALPLATVKAPAVDRVPVRHVPKRLTRQSPEMLKVKMLTADPDVVIYWIVETKEGTE